MRRALKRLADSAKSQGSSVDHRDGGSFTNKTDSAPRAYALILGLTVGLLVVAPLIGNGWVLLTDTTPGPNPNLPRSFWGLDGGLTTSVVLHVGSYLVGGVIGHQITAWLLILTIFPVAAVGMASLTPGGVASKLIAACFYILNPMIADRIWVGHIGFLLGYALLPFVLKSLLRARDAHGVERLRPALWIGLAGALSPHFLWIGGLLVAAVAATALRRPARTAKWLASLSISIVALNLYVLPSLGAESGGFTVGESDLNAYATIATDPGGIYGTVATLQGFWRSDPAMPSAPSSATVPVFLTVGAIAAFGVYVHLRRREAISRPTIAVLLMSGLTAFFLALGTKGPTGALFQFAFDNIPGFEIMREPQKFVSVVALALSVLFGFGAGELIRKSSSALLKTFATTAQGLLPVALMSSTLFGFSGDLRAVEYPESWAAANKSIGKGDGSVLYLPWHQYAVQTFTDGRIIAQPAEAYFSRPVISGDNVELPGIPTASQSPRSRYLETLFSNGTAISSFGQLIAPLGVEFVLVGKNNDWRNFNWLGSQSDLQLESETDDLMVYKNLKYRGVGFPITQMISVNSVAELIDLSNRSDISGSVVQIGGTSSSNMVDATTGTRKMQQISNVEYQILENGSGYYSLRESRNPGWQDSLGIDSISGTTVLSVPPDQDRIDFQPWAVLRLLYALSVVSAIALLVFCNLRAIRTLRTPATSLTDRSA